MNLNTRFHGLKEYKEEEIIYFKKGLPGFEELKKFILFPVEGAELFSILHSIENDETGIVVTSPFNVEKNYEVQLSNKLIEELKVEKEIEVMVLNTVTLDSKIEKITVNMKAPIIINVDKGLGEQIILDDDKYLIKHPLIQE